MEGEHTERLHQEQIRELGTTIDAMQRMVDNMKDNLEQLSFNSPITVAVQTVEKMIQDNQHDALGVQAVSKDMTEALNRMRTGYN